VQNELLSLLFLFVRTREKYIGNFFASKLWASDGLMKDD